MPDRQYPSAVDTWLATILIGAPLVSVALGLYVCVFYSVAGGLIGIAAGLSTGALIALLTLPCHYTLTDRSLKIKAGWYEDEVPLARIRQTESSRSMLSAPALSLNRVKIILDDGFHLVSPKDRAAFIADLEARRAALKG